MGMYRCVRLGVVILALQALSYTVSEQPPCAPGFDSELYLFEVDRVHLHVGRRLGKVVFDDCTGRTRILFDSADKRFKVDTDGTVKLKRQVTLHDGHKRFAVHAWDSQGKKHTADVRLELIQPHKHHNEQHQDQQVDVPKPDAAEVAPTVPVLLFPKSYGGLKRRKRDWIIPDIKVSENNRGPFPEQLFQIKSSFAKEVAIVYTITGPGADEAPKNLFTIDKFGFLYITAPLDREAQAEYPLLAHAKMADGNNVEDPTEINIVVIDQNDNKPVFKQNPFLGSVAEAAKIGTEFLDIVATDADEPGNDNSDIRYEIISQNPKLPNANMFTINPVTGKLMVNSAGLDKEKFPKYTLEIQVADYKGQGLTARCQAIITVTDSNDHAPQFEQSLYTASVPENKVGETVVKMLVTDGDDPNTDAWATKFKIISGDTDGVFSIETDISRQAGIIKTAKPLDYEAISKYTLVVAVENEIPFAVPLPTATAQVVVNVLDVNEAPVFDPEVKKITSREDDSVGTKLVLYTATDPDIAKKQTLTYRVGDDQAGWLNVDSASGLITVKTPMDRESVFVKDGQYKAVILATDNDAVVPATGTGTLMITLEDVNDNAPDIVEKNAKFCNEDTFPVQLLVIDKDSEVNAAPFSVRLMGASGSDWTAKMNSTANSIILMPRSKLAVETYSVNLSVSDRHGFSNVRTIQAEVCNCKGRDVTCDGRDIAGAGSPLPFILGAVGALILLLLLILLLAMYMRKKRNVKKEPLLPEDDVRGNLYFYDEEGGGEDDQDYDLGVLHRGLDNRPDVFRNDVIPTFMTAPQYQYRPRPANPDDIGNYIDDNLKAADNDPTAPPYDCLLVFDTEGAGSEAGTLSSIESSHSGDDQDYDCLNAWGPRFKKLADMYGGGEDDDML